MLDARARKFDCLPVWKLDRFGRSLVDCLENIRTLGDRGIRFIAVTQSLDTDRRNPSAQTGPHHNTTCSFLVESCRTERYMQGLPGRKLNLRSLRTGLPQAVHVFVRHADRRLGSKDVILARS
jgi:hypothetical protein